MNTKYFRFSSAKLIRIGRLHIDFMFSFGLPPLFFTTAFFYASSRAACKYTIDINKQTWNTGSARESERGAEAEGT